MYGLKAVPFTSKGKLQISPLRFAPVEMTNLLQKMRIYRQ
jgi:hypothetical protein